MEPFDPDANFEDLVLALNAHHSPGSVTSGKTRNVLIECWAFVSGRERSQSELQAAIVRHGSKTKLAKSLHMSPATLSQLEAYFSTVPERRLVPSTSQAWMAALAELSSTDQIDVASIAAALLSKPELLNRLKRSPEAQVTTLLEYALRTADLREAVERLRELLETNVVEERAYQDWCDRHSWVFSGTHRSRDTVRRVNEDSILDLMLPDLLGYRDVVELKRPDAQVLRYDRSHRTYYFSVETAKAISQVHKYMDRLHDLARDGLKNHPHIIAYHPQATVIIGRSNEWIDKKNETLRGLNQRLHGITVITYDHLVMRAEAILVKLTREAPAHDL